MAKISKAFRLDQKIIDALELLSEKGGMTKTIEMLVFREAIYKLSASELQSLFGDDYERLMLMYAVSKK